MEEDPKNMSKNWNLGNTKNRKRKDYCGKKFNFMEVIRDEPDRIFKAGNRARMVLCRCECGQEKVVQLGGLISGGVKSCGCLQKERASSSNKTHGMKETRIYKIWSGMKKRCNNTACAAYKNYGGRGIKYEERWEKFENFFNDMSNSYSGQLSLDRIDNDGDYCLSNCRWATREEQANNTRNNHFITINGICKTVSQWSRETGINRVTISNRINKLGWSECDAISIITNN